MTFQTRNMFEKAWHNENSKVFQEQPVYLEESLWERRDGDETENSVTPGYEGSSVPCQKLGTLSRKASLNVCRGGGAMERCHRGIFVKQ